VRLNRFVLAPIIVLVVAGIVAGLLTGAFASVARSGLYATGLLSDGGASTIPPDTFGRHNTPSRPATPDPEPRQTLLPVLAPASSGRIPNAARVKKLVDGVDRKAMKGSFSGSVIDAGTGKVLYANNGRTGYIPASTTKLLTTTAALSILGPEHRFVTKVVRSGPGGVVLVGGGDPYLTVFGSSLLPGGASLKALAKATARQLKAAKQTKVTLGYDTSLFTGPSWNADWPEVYRDQVTPTSALWVNEGRSFGSPGPRVSHPAAEAAEDFGQALTRQGIRVSKVSPARAAKGAKQVAAVNSMPLERIVEHLLMVSDNDAAEVLSRQAAIGAGKTGSYAAGRAVAKDRLTKLGVWDPSTRLRDGSGLSRKTKVSADTMAKVLRLGLQTAHPELRGVATGLPVAGVEGSLRVHYGDTQSRAGRGLVRGKTGTLSKVHTRAGYVRSVDGSLLVFAFLVNNPKNDYASIIWLDRVSSALSTCGCR
jgi:D-alanyl-D-alanine carboxypeptidase/D-alanyl-D-alanine-endopeptidase (penicillin-binding protein 4)